jgi:hypothetical protein
MTTTSMTGSELGRPSRLPVPIATVAGRVGASFVAVLGVVHAIVNTMGFAQLGFGPWGDYLIFGLGLTGVAFLLAFGAWTIAASRQPRWIVAGLVGLGALGLMLQLTGIVITDPALLLRPLGPGLWSLVGGPALLIEVVALAVRWRGTRTHGTSERPGPLT